MAHEDAKRRLTDIMEKLAGMGSKWPSDDVYTKLKECGEKEDSDTQKVIYNAYFENLDIADKLSRPCCQDTEFLRFYIRVGTGLTYQGTVTNCLREVIHNAICSAPLRQSTMNYFEERNINDNTDERMPWINWDIVPDNNDLEIITCFADGGCCLPGRLQVFKPSDGYVAIIQYVLDTVSDLGTNVYPPLIVGMRLEHNTESTTLLSKKTHPRPLSTGHPHPKGTQLKQDSLEGLNKLRIGAQGLRGNCAAMEVYIESSARHAATTAIDVNVTCYIHRRGMIQLHNDLSHETLTYKEITL